MSQPRGCPSGGRSSLKLRRTTLRGTQWGQLDDRIFSDGRPFLRARCGRRSDATLLREVRPSHTNYTFCPHPFWGRGSRRGSLNLRVKVSSLPRERRVRGLQDSYLVDSASSHMLVSKIKPCMSKYKQSYCETANGSLNQLSFI